MKFFRVLLLSVFFINLSFSQFLENHSMYEQYGIKLNQLVRESRNNINLEDINNEYNYEGLPYLTTNFVVSDLIFNGKKIGKYLTRYNIFGDEIQVKDTEKTYFSLLKSNNLEVVMNNVIIRPYQYDIKTTEKTYFIVVVDNKNCSLLLKKGKRFSPAVKAKTSFHSDKKAKFTDFENYYLKFDTSLPIRLRLKTKKVINLFPENRKSEIEDYIKVNSIDVTEENDLIKLVNYYNSLVTL